jgi:hypothetical protein
MIASTDPLHMRREKHAIDHGAGQRIGIPATGSGAPDGGQKAKILVKLFARR